MIFESSNEVVMGNAQQTAEFKIAANPKAFKILSSNLYKHKIRAIIRELSCNAIDAHVMTGQTRPFEITMPCTLDPRFIIRDFGPGISPEDIVDIYTVYFVSTKTDSNEQIGGLGLGAKTPFSYAHSFNVNSFHNGKVYGYSAVLTDQGPVLSKTFIEDMKPDDLPGLEVVVPVKSSDIPYWDKEAAYILRTFGDVKPVIKNQSFGIDFFTNEEMAEPRMVVKPDAMESKGLYAIYGRIVYPLTDVPGLKAEWLKSVYPKTFFNFKLGQLDIAPSREELSLDDRTIAVLLERINTIDSELFEEAIRSIQDEPNVRKAARIFNNFSSNQREVIKKRGVILSDGSTINDVIDSSEKAKGLNNLIYTRSYQLRKQASLRRLNVTMLGNRKNDCSIPSLIDYRQERIDIIVQDKKGKVSNVIRGMSYIDAENRVKMNLPENGATVLIWDEVDNNTLIELRKVMGLDPVYVWNMTDLWDKVKEYDPLYAAPSVKNSKGVVIHETRPAAPNVYKFVHNGQCWTQSSLRLTASELDGLKGLALGINRDDITSLDGHFVNNLSPSYNRVVAAVGITEYYMLRPSAIARFKTKPNDKLESVFEELAVRLQSSLDKLDVQNYIVPSEDRMASSVETLGLGKFVYGDSYTTSSSKAIRTWHRNQDGHRTPFCRSAEWAGMSNVVVQIDTLYGDGRERAQKCIEKFKKGHIVASYYMDRCYTYSPEIKAEIYHLLGIQDVQSNSPTNP